MTCMKTDLHTDIHTHRQTEVHVDKQTYMQTGPTLRRSNLRKDGRTYAQWDGLVWRQTDL